MEDQEHRILAMEFQLGIKQDVQPRCGMRFRWKSKDDSAEWRTILGTWRYESSKPPRTQGPTWWVVQGVERDPYLISEELLMNILQNVKVEIEKPTDS